MIFFPEMFRLKKIILWALLGLYFPHASAFSFGKLKVVSRDSAASVVETQEKEPYALVLSKNPTIAFNVKNEIGRKVYAVSFAYLRRFIGDNWHWHKTAILELDPEHEAILDFGSLANKEDALAIFGNICVFDSYEDALISTAEEAANKRMIDLDIISHLNHKSIALTSSFYGVKGERFSYRIISATPTPELAPLDYVVVNESLEPIIVTSFLYGRDQDLDAFSIWRFSKSDLYEVQPGEHVHIKVEKYTNAYDRKNVKGYLGVFKSHEIKKAENAVYELLKPAQKFSLGRLSALDKKQVVVSETAYGLNKKFMFSIRSV
jgi:hypothetical protein